MRSTSPRIGVVGAGWWSTQCHIPALLEHDGAELVAIADRDGARLTAAAERFEIEHAFLDAEELFASGLVDGVVIAVPHASHHALAKAALEADLHVMAEKPLTLHAHHAWELVRTAEERALHLMVGYTYQFTPAAQRCHDIIRSGRIGEILHISGLFASMVESYYSGRPDDYASVMDFRVAAPSPDTYSDPRVAGGGQAQTQVTHAMGMVLWVTGQAVAEVSAYMSKRDLAVDLADAIAYRTETGAVGTMGATGSLRPGQPRQQELRYYGTDGFVLQDLRCATLETHFNDGTSDHVEPGPGDDVYPTGATATGLADLIAGRSQNLAPAAPAARTVEFVEAAYHSARLGHPVRTDELETLRTDVTKEPWS